MSQTAATLNVRALGPIATAARVWRTPRALWVTVIAKATFAFHRDGVMQVVEPEPIAFEEQHAGGDPTRSLRQPSDLSPRLPRAEVLVLGAAYLRPGTIATARLGLFGRSGAILAKSLAVRGDPASPGPLERVELCYENAYGGVGHAANPIGRGADGVARPTVTHPDDPRRTACFGPISRHWPVRRERLPEAQRRRLDDAVVEFPDDFDFGYEQAAPDDQQIDRLAGDEWIVLEGMRPDGAHLRTRLPGAVLRARLHLDGVLSDRLGELGADRLLIDSELERCTLTWRASFSLPDVKALAGVEISAGLELPDQPIAWPASGAWLTKTVRLGDGQSAAVTAPPPAPRATEIGSATAMLSMTQLTRAAKVGGLPFQSDHAPAGQRVPIAVPGASMDPAHGTGTVTVRLRDLGLQATPFEPRRPPASRMPSSPEAAPATPPERLDGAAEPPAEIAAPSEQPDDEVAALAEAAPAARARRSAEQARVRWRALSALLTTEDADLSWFLRHKTGPESHLGAEDLGRIRAILETLSDVLEASNDEEHRRIELAWKLLSKDAE